MIVATSFGKRQKKQPAWGCFNQFPRIDRTMPDITFPSATPASCWLAMPITLPMSAMELAPVCWMMDSTFVRISSSESC